MSYMKQDPGNGGKPDDRAWIANPDLELHRLIAPRPKRTKKCVKKDENASDEPDNKKA